MGVRLTITGTVQGVGFRPCVYRLAQSMGLNGSVRNDGASVVIELDRDDGFVDALRESLPPLARIESVSKEPADVIAKGFSIDRSSFSGSGIGIPTDTAVCPECLKEMRSEGRRKGYPFTTCTNCGARFTLMETMPYDRARTAMSSFPKCPECGREYDDPGDRRFHHQTVCCPVCGPSYRLTDSKGNEIPGDPIAEFAAGIDAGKIGIAKSWGGMHICASIDRVSKLREWYRRRYKPFAVMVRDEDTVFKYADPTESELREMTSPHRPIVLVNKRETVPEEVSPGLDTVGMFLPYSGMHFLLFDHLKTDAVIMTSANLPGEPMVLDDRDALEMGADMYLLHNQRIINRADDSVVKMLEDRTYFLRKSRGHIPSYIDIPLNGSAIAVGPQENITATVSVNGRMHTTQHIGNAESIGVVEYLDEAVRSLMDMTGCRPQMVAMDLHPGYANRKVAKRIAEECDAEVIEVQHHWAHCASLMADAGIYEMAALAVDGTGHGTDGAAWGGEVMTSDLSSYDRVAHLEYIPLIGGDAALKDIRRLRFAIDRINGEESQFVTDTEASVFSKMIGNSVMTSSLGRVLDAVSYSLGVCEQRTYDGEPAMRLEPLLERGRRLEGFDTSVDNGVIGTAHLFQDIPKNARKEDVAVSIVSSIVDTMTDCACDAAAKKGLKHIGITGGVSYSLPISRMFRDRVIRNGFIPVLHRRVPNGDGGISVGQAAIALKGLE